MHETLPIEEVAEGLKAESAVDVTQALTYLSHYGYLAGGIIGAGPWAAVVSLGAALSTFQHMAGLPVTGELDEATLLKMSQPRCGHPDFYPASTVLGNRVAAMIEEARWRKTSLTYFVGGYVNGIPHDEQLADLASAWHDWLTAASGGLVKIERTPSQANADMVIATGQGAAQNFDGPSGTLAWAYLPTGNDRQLLMRFDLAEQWTRTGGGIRFRNVACHEFGHLLGLEHSRVSTALMAPFYSPGVVSPQQDDVARIRALYPPVPGPIPPTPGNPPTPPPDRTRLVLLEFNANFTEITKASVS